MRRLAALLALGCVTCSLVIAGESAPLPCSQEGQRGPPACDEGFTCQAGLCSSEPSVGGASHRDGGTTSQGGVAIAGEPQTLSGASGSG